MSTPPPILIGWAEVDITPSKPVLLRGQHPARLSEEVLDPLKAVALVLQADDEQAVMVSCDLCAISTELSSDVLQKVQDANTEIDPSKIILNATHTHTAPENSIPRFLPRDTVWPGVDLGNMPIEEYLEFASSQIADAIVTAWQQRQPGGIAYGLDYAVLARNRRWVNRNGEAKMYGLDPERFSHIEGSEDHGVNFLATYDVHDNLTGLVVNMAMTAQEIGTAHEVSADVWHYARQELRKHFGEKLYVLPQVSAAGDLSPSRLYEREANDRMLKLRNHSMREELARRIAQAAQNTLPYLVTTIEKAPVFSHINATVNLPKNLLSEQDVRDARQELEHWEKVYDEELAKLQSNPALKEEKQWYSVVTRAFRHITRYHNLIQRYDEQKHSVELPTLIHAIRLSEIVFISNPFEYYLDFGIQIKARSPAIQTFIVQLAGNGSYIPSLRSIEGGGYGSTPVSNIVGPDGGQVLADESIQLIRSLWVEETVHQMPNEE
jgi:hypothetical protein